MSLRRDLRIARQLSPLEWRLLAEAASCLVVARLAVWVVPFSRLATGLGGRMAESPTSASESQRAAAAPIGWAVEGLGDRLPGMRQCLVQALAATWMLKRRSIPSTVYFGAAKGEDEGPDIRAHAWVRSGPLILTGAKQHDDYRVVATFAVPYPTTTPEFALPPEDDLQGRDTS